MNSLVYVVNKYCTVPTVTDDSHSPHLPCFAAVCISFLLMNYVQLCSGQAAYLPQFMCICQATERHTSPKGDYF